MDGLFVFDQQNDIVFKKLNDNINKKLFELAKKQELLLDDAVRDLKREFSFFQFCIHGKTIFHFYLQAEGTEIDTNIIVQLFSPIIASQRIMFCQFDNSYTSIQLEDDLKFVFEEVKFSLLLSIWNSLCCDIVEFSMRLKNYILLICLVSWISIYEHRNGIC